MAKITLVMGYCEYATQLLRRVSSLCVARERMSILRCWGLTSKVLTRARPYRCSTPELLLVRDQTSETYILRVTSHFALLCIGYMPKYYFDAIYSDIKGSTKLDGADGIYSIPCDTKLNVSMVFKYVPRSLSIAAIDSFYHTAAPSTLSIHWTLRG